MRNELERKLDDLISYRISLEEFHVWYSNRFAEFAVEPETRGIICVIESGLIELGEGEITLEEFLEHLAKFLAAVRKTA
jgi:hypothetical protein